jgi:hypothetical protein
MEFVVVVLGIALAFLYIPIRRLLTSIRDERRAVRQFRACYRQAKLTIVAFAVNGDRNSWTESEVIYLALETMKTREDIKCGKHRFGESVATLAKRADASPWWLNARRIKAA